MRIRAGLLCIIFSFISLSVGSALSESLTYDEVFYLEEGRRIWNTRTFSDPYNPPLAPLLAGFSVALGFATPIAARLVSIGLGVLLILAVYHVGGLPAALLLSFEPTVLANSHYVTGDIAVTLFVFLAAMAWRRFLKRGGFWHAILLGLASGYALSSKMTSLVFLPIAFFVVWYRRPIKKWRRLVGSALIALFVLWASYLFTWDVLIREREDVGRVSARFVAYARGHNLPTIESVVTFFREQTMPLGTYAATVKNNILRVGRPAMVFFDGAIYVRSRWYFMIVNMFRKIPIPLLFLVAFGIRRAWRSVMIAVGIVAIASLVGMMPLVRYVLPAMPFLALVAASGIRVIGEIWGIGGKILISVLLLWYVVGTALQYPHFISYANELVGSRERRYEVLVDSNLDWGQGLPDLVHYIKAQRLGKVKLSYFGRDDAAAYGLPSVRPYGSWRFEEICAFHDVVLDADANEETTVISVSNWYYCGYNKEEVFRKENIQDVVSDSLLVF